MFKPFLSSAMATGMSRLCLSYALPASSEPSFSPTSFDFDFWSPSISSSSASDSSVVSTPLTIAPSVLSSPHSTWDSPALPTIAESYLDETAEDDIPADPINTGSAHSPSPASSPIISDNELIGETASKRKRSKAKQTEPIPEVLPQKTRARRAPRSVSPAKATPSYPRRAGKTTPKAIAPAPPAPKRTLAPLPSRSLRSRSSSVSSTSSSSPNVVSPRSTLPATAVTNAACCDDAEHKHEIPESDDSGSEYEAEVDDEYDDDYRPTKRTRSQTSSTRAASPGSSVAAPVRRKAVSPKVAAEKTTKRKKKSSSSRGGKKKRGKAKAAVIDGPKPTCIWCDREFTRESDVLRHELSSCKLYPFDRPQDYCPLCDKIISRNDAVIRHQASDDCKKRQRELGRLKAKTAKTKAGAKVAQAVSEPLSPRRRRTKS